MYGLLMLLPQSDAFKTLHARLHSVPTVALLQIDSGSGGTDLKGSNSVSAVRQGLRRTKDLNSSQTGEGLDFAGLVAGFKERQTQHAAEEEQRQDSLLMQGASGEQRSLWCCASVGVRSLATIPIVWRSLYPYQAANALSTSCASCRLDAPVGSSC